MKAINISTDTKQLLDYVAEEGKSHYEPEYQEKQTKADLIGVELSSYFEWDCLALNQLAMAALEDANDHEMVQIIENKLKERGWIN
jgi:hypothetical protein